MAEFVNDVLGMVPEADWLDVGFNVTRQNDPVDRLFGDIRTDNLFAKWQSIAAEYQVPMMASFHAFDTESLKTFRVPVDTHNIEKGLIKVKLDTTERMRALLNSGVRRDQMYDYIVNDGARLAEQVFTRSKVCKNEVMADGKVSIKENNLDISVDYGVPKDQIDLETGLDLAEDADLIGALQDMQDAASKKGQTLNGLYTSRRIITKMRRNKSIQGAINGALMQGQMVRQTAFEAFMEEEFGIGTIITNDLTYGANATMGENGRPTITTARYYPSDRMTFFASNPAGKLGDGIWGNPPEVDVDTLMQVNASGEHPYVYITQWTEHDPAVLWTKASGLFMPVLYNPNSLWIKKEKNP